MTDQIDITIPEQIEVDLLLNFMLAKKSVISQYFVNDLLTYLLIMTGKEQIAF